MTDAAPVQAPCPWHRDALTALQQRQQDGRLPHALLLTGPAGLGKGRLALALVHWLLCEAPRGGLACGRCHACHMSTSGTHPDLIRVEPAEAGKAIRIDQIRELVEFAGRTAQYGGHRLVLLQPAQAMNRAAQNALLKTLEEPGDRTLLLLVCDQPSALLPTVRSRCQQLALSPPEPTMAEAWLAGQLAVPDRAAALLGAAGGAPLRALELEQADWFIRRGHWVDLLGRVARGQVPVTVAAREMAAQDVAALLAASHGWVRHALRRRHGRVLLQDEELERPLEALAQVPEGRLLRVADALVRARRLWHSGANPNRELLLEQWLLVLAGQRLPELAP